MRHEQFTDNMIIIIMCIKWVHMKETSNFTTINIISFSKGDRISSDDNVNVL